MCREDGVEPEWPFSGKLNLRMSVGLHAEIAAAAATESKSINQWINDELRTAAADPS